MESLNWRKASYSAANGGGCVEVADHSNRVLVRDTQDRTGPVLRFTSAAWRRFADQVKRSLLAHAPTPAGATLASEGGPYVLCWVGWLGLAGMFPRRAHGGGAGVPAGVVLVPVSAGIGAVCESA